MNYITKLPNLIPAALALLILTTCDREFNNPWDDNSSLPSNAWAPKNLQIETINITEKKLTWTYGDHNIEGFRIARKNGNEPWDEAHMTLPKEARSWSDTQIIPDPLLIYSYQVYAYAGNNTSSRLSVASSSSAIPPPTNLQIEVNSITSVNLTWQDNSEGEEGFKIDRKISDGDLQVEFAVVSANQTYFTDDNVSLAYNIYSYRVYAFSGTWNSAYSEATIQVLPPTVTTNAITEIAATNAISGGNVISDGGLEVTARGIIWSKNENPTLEYNEGYTEDGAGTGSFTSNLTDLESETTYYVKAYSTNSLGTSYGEQVVFTTKFACGEDVTFTYHDQSVTYGTVEGQNGTCWLDRNLGASRVATAYNDSEAYGDLFQWGRGDDGHQLRTSEITSSLSNSDNPGHGNFITVLTEPHDWRSPQNDNLWQGDGGINDVCPAGWRVPTETELNNERMSWSSNNYHGAFASPLRFVAGGTRFNYGSLLDVGSYGGYWSSSVSGSYARYLDFGSSNAGTGSYNRVYGSSVRCIRDD